MQKRGTRWTKPGLFAPLIRYSKQLANCLNFPNRKRSGLNSNVFQEDLKSKFSSPSLDWAQSSSSVLVKSKRTSRCIRKIRLNQQSDPIPLLPIKPIIPAIVWHNVCHLFKNAADVTQILRESEIFFFFENFSGGFQARQFESIRCIQEVLHYFKDHRL